MGIDDFYCTKEKDFALQGDFYLEDFRYIEIKLMRCVGTQQGSDEPCAKDSEIDAYFHSEVMSFAFVNTFFDFFDLKDPVKYFIDDSLFFELEKNKIKKTNFYVKKSEAELQ